MSTSVWPARSSLLAGALAMVGGAGLAAADRGHKPAPTKGDHKPDAAERTEKVSLSEVLASAVHRSPTLAMARSDHSEGHAAVGAAEAVDQWHLLGRAYGQDSIYPRALAGAGTALDTRSFSGELGLSRSLFTGGELGIAIASSEVNYLYPTLTANSMISPMGSYVVGGMISSLRLTASQPLVRGIGEDVARADQKLQRLAGRSLTADSEDEAAGLVRDLIFAYWELAYATEALAVDREGEQLAVKQVAITQEVVRAGTQPPSAVKLAELQVALRREAILRDESTVLDHSLALRRLAGLEMSGDVLVPSDEAVVPTDERAEADVIEAALARGPGMAQKRLAQRGAEVTVDVTSNARLPRVDLSVSAELSGVGSSLGESVSNVGTGQLYTIMGGMTVQWDLGGAASAAAARAEAHRARVEGERAELDRELEASAVSQARQLVRARQRVALAQVAVDVAAEVLRAEVVAFQAGRSTNVLVFQREDDVAQAKVRLARARVDAIEADLLIDYLGGALLTRYGIKWTDTRSRE